ncbi:hypothetical protein BZL31_02005 [Escherichia coli]|nr:hypothetical protein BZL31_02005 [Escherichia coli]
MALTARQVETARPKEKDYKLSDERGLYLLVKTTGARYWRLKYRIAGKEKKLALGVYPDVSLAEARIKRDDARKIISEGGDPGEKKRKEKLTQKISATNTSQNQTRRCPKNYLRRWRPGRKEAKGKTHSENLCHQYVPCPCYGMASA